MDSVLLENSSFHNPVLNLKDESKKNKVKEVVKDFVLPLSKLRKIEGMFLEEIRLGLEANPPRKSVFYMCNTFVTQFPDGSEEGDVMSMDLGGTNLRILLTRLRPGKQPEYLIQPYDIDIKYRRGKPEHLFDFLVVCIDDFLNKVPELRNKRIPFGFTFSFGFDQIALDKAIVTQFSLETDIPDAIGNDAVQYLREAIDRKGLNIDIISISNDTTAVLALGLYMDSEAAIGFILGSGTNTCYMERIDRIKKIDPITTFGSNAKYVIINTECGFLGDNGSMNFAKTKFDLEVDEESLFPHNYTYEKLIGGIFIGDLVRRVLLSIAETNVLLNGKITEELKTKDSIKGPDVSAIESDETDNSGISLLQRLGYLSSEITSDDIQILRYVCALVSVRNALLAAANLSAVVQHIDRPSLKIACDGSLIKKHPKLRQLITDFIKELVPNRKVELIIADDGSGKGSALIAAVALKSGQNNR